MTSPGGWLREVREERHLTRSAVQRATAEIAKRHADEGYWVRRGRLADIEDGRTIPDIVEVASLCECYRVSYHTVLHAFGMNMQTARLPEGLEPHGVNQQWSFADADRPFSLSFQTHVSFDETRIVTEGAEELGVPAAVRQRLDEGQFRLGIIGLNDDTMGELVPAGSVVVIDKSDNRVEMADWKSIRERPIYFSWHEKGYSCSWCYLAHDTLFIVPYPTSRKPVMIFKTPRAATIIGRIVHVWSPLVAQGRPA